MSIMLWFDFNVLKLDKVGVTVDANLLNEETISPFVEKGPIFWNIFP